MAAAPPPPSLKLLPQLASERLGGAEDLPLRASVALGDLRFTPPWRRLWAKASSAARAMEGVRAAAHHASSGARTSSGQPSQRARAAEAPARKHRQGQVGSTYQLLCPLKGVMPQSGGCRVRMHQSVNGQRQSCLPRRVTCRAG